MKGQLNGLSIMVGKMGSNGDSATAALGKALQEITQTTKNPSGPTGYKGLTNAELKSKAIAMVQSVRLIEDEYESAQSFNPPHYDASKSKEQFDTEWRNANSSWDQNRERADQTVKQKWQPIRVECGLLIDEITSRLPAPAIPKDLMTDSVITMVFKYGGLAGAYPLKTVGDYLERLALLLPQAKSGKR